jgi:hypothetical protein
MSPSIDISQELYNRLSKLVEGFDTPESVIERLLDERSGKESKPSAVTKPAIIGTFRDTADYLNKAFEEFFNVAPRPFGQKTGTVFGFSDDSKGVQWNVGINFEDGSAVLGVNLEGMKYRDWPIATLLLRERDEPTLPSLSALPGAEDITVQLNRDAWQCAARPPIQEKLITGSGTPLASLSKPTWSAMVEEALSCLDASQGYRGRAAQKVTLIKSGDIVEKEVSPHLSVTTTLWKLAPNNQAGILEAIQKSHDLLSPIYSFIRELCVDKEKDIFKKEISTDDVTEDPNQPIYTMPKSYGVYEIKDKHIKKAFRQGNHPIRLKELRKEFGDVSLKALYLEKDLAAERARFESGSY